MGVELRCGRGLERSSLVAFERIDAADLVTKTCYPKVTGSGGPERTCVRAVNWSPLLRRRVLDQALLRTATSHSLAPSIGINRIPEWVPACSTPVGRAITTFSGSASANPRARSLHGPSCPSERPARCYSRADDADVSLSKPDPTIRHSVRRDAGRRGGQRPRGARHRGGAGTWRPAPPRGRLLQRTGITSRRRSV